MTRRGVVPCPVEGCQEHRSTHQLTCPAHWQKLPKLQRDRVIRAWENYKATRSDENKRAAYQAWFTASRSAIKYLNNLGNRARAS